jgi:hypothetical protein
MNRGTVLAPVTLKSYELMGVTEPLLLKAGTVTVYLQKCQNQQPIGRRQFLFSAHAGEMIWATNPDSNYQFWLEAEGEVELQPLGEEVPIGAIAPWVHHLGNYLASFQPPPVISLYCQEEEHFTLLKGQKLRPKKSELRLIQVTKGEVKWQGDLAFVLLSGSGWLPLGDGMWIEAVAPNNLVKVEVDITTPDRLRPQNWNAVWTI